MHVGVPANSVVAFLGNAERQSETIEQQREILRALDDMLAKAPGELRATRYRDYRGAEGAWTLPQLLQRYFAPDPPRALDERFWDDVAAPEAKAVVRRQRDALVAAMRPPG